MEITVKSHDPIRSNNPRGPTAELGPDEYHVVEYGNPSHLIIEGTTSEWIESKGEEREYEVRLVFSYKDADNLVPLLSKMLEEWPQFLQGKLR